MVGGALSLFSAQSVSLWLSEWSKWVFVFVLILLILQFRRWEWAAFALACAGIANAVLGFYVYFGGSGVTHFAINAQNFRAFGTFEQPNPFGGFMGILTPFLGALSVGYLVRGWQVFRRERRLSLRISAQMAFFGLAAVLTAVALIFSWSRGAWLALAAAVMVTAIMLPRRMVYGLAVLGIVGAAGGALWVSGRLPASITDRVISSFSDLLSADDVRGVDVTPENYAAIERFAHWQAAVEMANRSPWLGVGLGNYEVAYPSVRLLGWDLPLGHAHNYYLNVLGEAGIIGFSSYLAMWFIIVLTTWCARRHPDPLSSAAAAGLLGSWVYIAFHSLTDHLYVNAVFLHVGVLIGIAALLYRQTWVPHRLKL
jgi:O-antigen ligase